MEEIPVPPEMDLNVEEAVEKFRLQGVNLQRSGCKTVKFPGPKPELIDRAASSVGIGITARKSSSKPSRGMGGLKFKSLSSSHSSPKPTPTASSKSKTGSGKRGRVTCSAPLDPESVDCFICGKTYKAQCQLNMHMDKIHFSPRVEKPKKEKKRKAEDSDGEEEHEISHHSNEMTPGNDGRTSELWICKCGSKFASRSTIDSHIAFIRRVNSFKCTKCPLRFCWESDLESHIKTDHGKVAE